MLALQDVLGLEDDAVLRAAGAMTGGVGGQHDACGGLLGAAMMFGTVYGRDRASMADREKMGELMPRVGKLYKWYEKRYGSATCADICTRFGGGVYYDMGVPWQRELAEEAGVHKQCDGLVADTVAYMVDQLWDQVKK